MVKRCCCCRDPDSDGTTSFKSVFVSTSLDTQLIMTLLFSDTVADFKKKVMLEHEKCYPKAGALTVHTLKVKYQGKLYPLHEPDMLVNKAFEGYGGRWFIFADASSLEVVKEKSHVDPCDKGKSECPRLPWKSSGESSKDQYEKLPSRNSTQSGGSLTAKKKQKVNHTLPVAGDQSTLKSTKTSPQTTTSSRSDNEAAGLEDSIVGAGPKVSTDVQLGGSDVGASPHNTLFSGTKTSEQAEPESHVFEKEAVYGHHSVDLGIISPVSDTENISLEKSVAELRENMTSPDVPSQQVQEEQPAISASTKKKKKRKNEATDVQLGGNTLFSGTKTYEQAEPESDVFEKEAVYGHHSVDLGIVSLVSDMESKSLEKSVAVLRENMTSPDVPSQQVEEEEHPVISASTKKKRKIKKQHQETTEILGSGNHGMVNDESLLTSTGNLENTYIEEDGRLSSDHEMGLSENVKPSDVVETAPAQEEIVICLRVLDKSPEADNSEVSKSKIRKSSKSDVRKQDQLDVEHDLGAPSNTEHAKEAESPMDQPDGEQKQKGTTKKKRKKKAKKTVNSTGEGLGILEVNSENIGDEKLASLVEKSDEERTIDQSGVSELGLDTLEVNGSDENRTIDQSGVSELGLGKNSDLKGTGRTEQLLQNSDDPEVPAHEIESNCEVRHAAVVSVANNGLESNGENGSVDFRRYFVPGDDHKEAASTHKVEGESNVVEGAEKADEQTIVPVVESAEKADEQTIVPEGKRRPSKSWGNQKNSSGINTADNSHEHSSSKAKQNKSAGEMETSTSSRKRSKSLKLQPCGKNNIQVIESAFQQDNKVQAGSSKSNNLVGKGQVTANVKALKKSVDPAIINGGSLTSPNLNSVSRDTSKILLNKSNQKKQRSINLKKTAAVEISRKKVKDVDKSSQEKSLLTTPGMIFGDGLSESSGDENGNMKSGSSTQSPSDSSSSSSSEDLMRQGSISKDHKGGKTASGPKLADTRNMSMDMILRSSSQFKKAKLTASQSEADSQQVDFVPESQPMH